MKNTELTTGPEPSEPHVVGGRSGLDALQSPLRSPLFLRIAAVVFISIVLIEVVVLVFSWFGERDRLLARIDDSMALLSPILSASEDYQELDLLVSHADHSDRHPLLGYVLQTSQGLEFRGGDNQGLLQLSLSGQKRRIDADSGIYDGVLSLSHEGEPASQSTLWYRIDASRIDGELQAYVLRIVGLVVLISLFVTGGCLLGLTPILIRPLQKLNQLILIGQRYGLRQVTAPAGMMARKDELGAVYRSFKQLASALIRAEDEKSAMTERFQGFADLGADSFWEFDRRLRISHAAGDIAGMFGLSPAELKGVSTTQLALLMARVITDFSSIAPTLKKQGFWEGQLQNPKGGAVLRTVRIVARVLRDEHGRFRGIRGTVVDISIASELAAELKYQASHDSLTGLYNRREFDQLLAVEMAEQKADNRRFCVCMLDLDRFKIVNDNCGHAAGDILLKQLATLINSAVRENDVVSRHGGDEFTVLLRDCALHVGVALAESIREAVNQYRFTWEEQAYSVGVSIGIAEVLPTMADAEEAILAADACCIKGKAQGRNQVQAYSPDDEVVTRQHGEVQWMARVLQALEEDRLLLYQQAIVGIGKKPDDEVHFEILLRMQGRNGSVYSPEEFLPAAERYGLVGKIDRWVVAQVIDWLEAQSVAPDRKLCINVNLSGMTVSDDSFQMFLREKLKGSGVSANHLCFEITESAAMGNTGRTVEFLKEIRANGCRVALDDFGTGFSSLSQVKQLPLDFIKIDGVFIQGIVDSQLDRALVRCVADFASILNVKTVAEFVDSEEVCKVLRSLDIDYAQGYLFDKPGPLQGIPDCPSYRNRAA